MAEVALDAEVGLLGVRVHEAFSLRISEWLKAQRQEGGGVQIVLIQENGLWEVQCLKALLVRVIAKRCGYGGIDRSRAGIRSIRNIDRQSLENWDCVQIPGIASSAAAARAAEG